ncbi:O-antigen ligase family protein [Rhodoligotrophos defluvii]|uniref:O-antigen ligase family protein n=1 Tax=Rhodoligotrophos defluvii TaxID=2561934 RepID=UPI0010C93F83|nr:O-antigen ligase family protein [Rhodoligotrophos defluvii]
MSTATDIRVNPGTALWARKLARWLPAITLFYSLFIWPVLYGRSPDTDPALAERIAENQSTLLNQVFFPAIFLVALFVWLATCYRRSPALRDPAVLLVALMLGLFVVSAGWSIVPDIALKRAILQITIIGTLILSIAAADDPDGVVDRIFWMLAAVLITNLAVVSVTAPGPLGYEGLFPQKNGLGAAAALGLLFALHQLAARPGRIRLLAWVIIPISLALLVLSKSKTSLGLALMVPPLVLAICIAARAFRLSVPVLVAGLIGAVVLVYFIGIACYVWTFESVAYALFGDPTLTTRTDIWAFASSMAQRHPWLGYGFESFWQTGVESPSFREAPGFVARMPHAHNGYVDIVLQTGFFGLGLLTLTLAAALGTAGQVLKRSFSLGYLCITLIVFLMLYNLLETAWFRGFDYMSMIFVLAAALAASARSKLPWNG